MAVKTLPRRGLGASAPTPTRVPLPTPAVGTILGKVIVRKAPYKLKVEHYEGGRMKIVAVDKDDDPFEPMTASVPSAPMASDEFAVRCHQGSLELVMAVGALRLFEDTGRKVRLGSTELSVWRLKPSTK